MLRLKSFLFGVLAVVSTMASTRAVVNVGILRSALVGPIVNTADGTQSLAAHYNGASGFSSTIVDGTVTSGVLASHDLFVIMLPDDAFTLDETTAISSFLDAGKHLLFIGDQVNFGLTQNGYMNTLLGDLGATIFIGGTSIGSGLANTTAGQILSDPLTSGVSLLNYGNINILGGGVGAASVLLTPDLTQSWARYETVSNGRVTVLADSNLLSNIGAAVNNDNGIFFNNIALAAVPEPSAYAILFGVMACFLVICRRRRRLL